MTTTVTKEKLVVAMSGWKRAAENRLKMFKTDIDALGAERALQSSEPAFDAGARLSVANYILDALLGKATPESVMEYAHDRMVSMSRGGAPSSSSLTRNLMDSYLMSTWANLYEGLRSNGIWW